MKTKTFVQQTFQQLGFETTAISHQEFYFLYQNMTIYVVLDHSGENTICLHLPNLYYVNKTNRELVMNAINYTNNHVSFAKTTVFGKCVWAKCELPYTQETLCATIIWMMDDLQKTAKLFLKSVQPQIGR